jgi:hypothetical protein
MLSGQKPVVDILEEEAIGEEARLVDLMEVFVIDVATAVTVIAVVVVIEIEIVIVIIVVEAVIEE